MNSTLARIIGLLVVVLLGFYVLKSLFGLVILGALIYGVFRLIKDGLPKTVANVINFFKVNK